MNLDARTERCLKEAMEAAKSGHVAVVTNYADIEICKLRCMEIMKKDKIKAVCHNNFQIVLEYRQHENCLIDFMTPASASLDFVTMETRGMATKIFFDPAMLECYLKKAIEALRKYDRSK